MGEVDQYKKNLTARGVIFNMQGLILRFEQISWTCHSVEGDRQVEDILLS